MQKYYHIGPRHFYILEIRNLLLPLDARNIHLEYKLASKKHNAMNA